MPTDERQNGTHTKKALASLAIAAVLLLGALLSGGLLSEHFSSPETYAHQIEQLDAKRDTVIKLATSSSAASMAISMIPGDVGMPIANQLADLSKDFTIVLAAILLEKYLLTTLGFVAFGVVAPICLVACAVATLMPRDSNVWQLVYANALKVLVVSVVVWGSIPASVFVTDRIEDTYEASIAEAIDSASQIGDAVGSAEAEEPEMSEGWRSQFFGFVSNPVGTISAVSEELVSKAQATLSSYIEGLAVMVVTACVIPALTPIFALWVTKLLLSRPLITLPSHDESIADGQLHG